MIYIAIMHCIKMHVSCIEDVIIITCMLCFIAVGIGVVVESAACLNTVCILLYIYFI